MRKSNYLGIGLVPLLLGSNPSGHQTIFDAVCQREVVIPGGGNISILAQSVVQMLVKSPFQIRNGFHRGDGTHGNLFFSLRISQTHFFRMTTYLLQGLRSNKNQNEMFTQ